MESESITELMTLLILQLGIIFFAVRFFGSLVKKLGIPQVLGELIAGIIIGPFALGGIQLPGFPNGIFPYGTGALAVSTELYAFAVVASIILLFVSGLETNIKLFLRYSFAGGIISTGGVVVSFAAGNLLGMIIFNAPFTDPRCLFLGTLITANSLGIVARLLSDQKKMDIPESATILAASGFDDVLTIIILSVVTGIVSLVTGAAQSTNNLALDVLIIAGKAFGIWLGVVVLGLLFSKQLARFLKIFKSTVDFSILALGLALILAGLFEKQGLAMIIGAYIAGLSLSKTDIAPVIHERIKGIYELFVPVFFAVMGMMVNFRDIINPQILIFGGLYAAVAIFAKLIGCGGPALLFGFNIKGALRIGLGMAPRGEMTLIIAGIGLAMGILDQQIFAVLILMILITTLIVPPFIDLMLKRGGRGTHKPVRNDDIESITWEFRSGAVADLVINKMFEDLRKEGFYVQVMNFDKELCHARKDDIFISIRENENTVTIETAKTDMQFVKTVFYEAVVELHEAIQKLKDFFDPQEMKKELMDSDGRTDEDLLLHICPECISINLKGETKEEVITELVDILAARGKIIYRDMVLADVLEREKTMSTGMEHGIALPHAKTDGADELKVAVGIKKEGIDFDASDREKSRLIILLVSPKKTSGPHIRFLAAIGALLRDRDLCEEIINSGSPEKAAELLQKKNKKNGS
ncbi:MAG: cation:proton antiporter [Treponema sp.]|jgi:Kef-type K+ transport system membrane component KefB/mannitol/fructose-specific phosphotransferase system IIA component (Ntr-type)|nr:cation:proton antiporter [Treponema sp.]